MSKEIQQAQRKVTAARAAEKLGDYEAAARHYMAASNQVTGKLRAWTRHQAAVTFRMCGQSQAALDAAKLASEAVQLTDDSYLQGQIELTTANILADQEHWPDAVELSRKAQQTFDSLGASVERLYGLIGEARCLAGMAEVSNASKIYTDLAAPGNPFEVRSQALNNLALLYIEGGDVSKGIKLMREDLLLCQKVNDVYGEFVAHVNLSQTLADTGSDKDARFHANTALLIGGEYKQTPPYKIAKKLAG
jgi:tetratricopeptide (TPR) repeat protein